MRRAALHNLGCKVNAYETEAMRELLEGAGYTIVPFEEEADVYIVNTCSVTNMADKKSRQMLHRARRRNPEAAVVAAGCYVQSAGEKILEEKTVDILVGNNEKEKLLQFLKEWEEKRSKGAVHDMAREKRYEDLNISRASEHTRAFMKIQDGCDQFCSYCIIPYTRGRVRSRRLSDILKEARSLAGNGYREVVLTGIHLDSYGADFASGEENLLSVVEKIARVDGIERIRLGSLEPRIMTEAFVERLSRVDKLCPHFHLSLQSGCDETLKRMNRKYNTREFAACCERLRRYFTEPALTTDVIVGFPGETQEEFAQTLEFLKKIRFYEIHVFKYSRRKGTKADRMTDQVPEEVKSKRSDILLKLTREGSQAYRERLTGSVQEVLMEDACRVGEKICQTGHTKEYVKVAVEADETLANRIVRVKIEGLLEPEMLYARLLSPV